TTPALAFMYPQERLRAEVTALETGREGERILIPVALPSSGPALLDVATAVAEGKAPQLYALHLAHPAERGALGARVLPGAPTADGALGPLLEQARVHNCEVHPLELVSRPPGTEICDVARTKGVELVVMGWHKPVFNQALLGGTVQHVMKESTA